MKVVKKREFMRKPSILSGLQPGQSVTLEGNPSLVVSRPKGRQITVEEMDAALDSLADRCPPIDTLEVVKEMRR
jgi:hypothetical protein